MRDIFRWVKYVTLYRIGREIKVGVPPGEFGCLFNKIINVIELNSILVTYTHLIVSVKPA